MQWLSSHSKSDPQVGLLKQKWERECGGRRGLDVDIYSWPGFPVRGQAPATFVALGIACIQVCLPTVQQCDFLMFN